MAAIEQFESRGISRTFGGDALYRHYIVDSSGDPSVAVNDGGLPVRGDTYEEEGLELIAVNIDVYRYSVDTCWATVTYAETMREEELEMGTEAIRVSLDQAGEAIGPFGFDPAGVMVDRPRVRLVIYRWQLGGVDERAILTLLGKVNEEGWRGWPKKFWKFVACPMQYSPPNLYRITYIFELMPVEEAPTDCDGWGPGWQWTWYGRNEHDKSKKGLAHTVDVFKTADFNSLDLET